MSTRVDRAGSSQVLSDDGQHFCFEREAFGSITRLSDPDQDTVTRNDRNATKPGTNNSQRRDLTDAREGAGYGFWKADRGLVVGKQMSWGWQSRGVPPFDRLRVATFGRRDDRKPQNELSSSGRTSSTAAPAQGQRPARAHLAALRGLWARS